MHLNAIGYSQFELETVTNLKIAEILCIHFDKID